MPTPAAPLTFQYACASDPGRVRANNEDAVLIDPALGLVVVADGMGGYNAGEVASRLCCDGLRAALTYAPADAPAAQRLQDALGSANHTVWAHAQQHPAQRGMATTVVAVLLSPNAHAVVAHVGDSRLYRLRQGQLALLTRDHSLVQQHIDAGLLPPELARAAGYRNLVTRAVGVGPMLWADVAEFDLAAGDTLLLCTDGLTDALDDPAIAAVLRAHGPLDEAAQRLVQAANEAGGRDNISVALVRCSPAGPTPPQATPPARRCGA
ncbi:MAG: protein phosphatase 2C domain-containing protein [Tepidimonas ignava]|uniref:Protein phosphatase n=1 Tax=Tepidimonas ignava TaxID=114249 RepID=A0A4V2UW35_9BURK|nr:PP2C family serine/threonine-protein phosphatase [Tepidimonas ignava]MCX7815177.1 protein phosphatase 2C domain-containing protein [Tepidimonas ignava]TCS97837.1 protein phosphatase [Tepidimonas ignava]TSE23699.1 putative protein phosphatase 2C-type [Tepidimonas ignava]